jgi:hypothetical protein
MPLEWLNQVGSDGRHQVLVYADNGNLLWTNIYTAMKNKEVLKDTSKKLAKK